MKKQGSRDTQNVEGCPDYRGLVGSSQKPDTTAAFILTETEKGGIYFEVEVKAKEELGDKTERLP